MKRLIVLLAATVASAPALADHPFILPSTTSFSGNNNVATFDAAASDHVFFMDHRPLQLASIKAWGPDGAPAAPYNTLQGRFRSVFDLKFDRDGTWKVASDQNMITGSFKLDGEERRVGGRPGGPPPAGGAAGGARPGGERGGDGAGQRDGRPESGSGGPGGQGGPGGEGGPRRQPPVAFQDIPANATDVHLTEISMRTETFVTAGEPTTTVLKPTGKGLEFDPITHPNALAFGETARFRFLVDGKPAAGIKVTVIPGGDRYRETTGGLELTAGADGVVSVSWPNAGMYWLGATAEDKNPSEKRAETRRMSYSATLEVMTP